MTEAEYLSVALSLGMGRREALLSPVGLVMEVAQLRADANKRALGGEDAWQSARLAPD